MIALNAVPKGDTLGLAVRCPYLSGDLSPDTLQGKGAGFRRMGPHTRCPKHDERLAVPMPYSSRFCDPSCSPKDWAHR